MAEINGKRFRRPRHWTLTQYLEGYSSPDPNSECLIWRAGRDKDGYGTARWENIRKAHRLAWIDANKRPIPPGMCVCHECDTPACINPDHLFLGTDADNSADKFRKGRFRPVKGSAQGNAKLIESQVLSIRADSRPSRRIAKEYGISKSHVLRIRRGESWGHI